MITDVAGVRVGHWTHREARTGCTVVLLPKDTVASGEVRGGAPATRETDLLDPTRLVRHVDAVVLSGGSAFGLAAADGVVAFLEEEGRGFPTVAGVVPIVVALGVYDLAVGDPTVRPGPDEGRAACAAAEDGPVALGAVGVGCGCTIAKWRGPDHRRWGGLVSATARRGDLTVAALVAVNAFGEPGADAGEVARAGSSAGAFSDAAPAGGLADTGLTNTTVGVVATNARLDKVGCHLVAQGAHDGLARAIAPVHTRADGDAMVAAATGAVDAEADVVRLLAVDAVARAVESLPRVVTGSGP